MDSVSTAVTSSVNAVMEKCMDTFKDMLRELERKQHIATVVCIGNESW